MNEIELTKKITETDCRIDRLEERMSILEKMQSQIQDLTYSVHDLSTSIRSMVEEQHDISSRLNVIEKEPIDKWRTVTRAILTCVVSAVAGGVIAHFL